jgi:hypothetical protein
MNRFQGLVPVPVIVLFEYCSSTSGQDANIWASVQCQYEYEYSTCSASAEKRGTALYQLNGDERRNIFTFTLVLVLLGSARRHSETASRTSADDPQKRTQLREEIEMSEAQLGALGRITISLVYGTFAPTRPAYPLTTKGDVGAVEDRFIKWVL